MRSPLFLTPQPWTLLVLLAFGCTSKDSEDDTSTAIDCSALTANAGPDQAIGVGDTVTLDGSGSVVCLTDGRTYTWSFESTPTDSAIDESALSDNKSATATSVEFTPDIAGDYVLALVVSDGEENSGSDIVVISVSSTDSAPIADCGGDKAGKAGEAVSLDGSASSDPEGAELEYSWSIASTPSCSSVSSTSIFDRAESVANIVPDCDGIFVISLVVSDGSQWSDPSVCSIDVSSENHIPVADAGDTDELPPCLGGVIELDGFGSYDLDADSLTYQWSLVSAPSGSAASDADFNDSTAADAKFNLPDDPAVAGDYTFQLQVFDGADWSAPDTVTYTVQGEEADAAPVANAGDDETIEEEADCTSADYVWTCADCEGDSVELDGTSSYDPDGDDLRYFWTEASGGGTLSLPSQPITDFTVGGSAATKGEDATTIYTIQLEVYDSCDESGTDELTVTYTCTGEAAS